MTTIYNAGISVYNARYDIANAVVDFAKTQGPIYCNQVLTGLENTPIADNLVSAAVIVAGVVGGIKFAQKAFDYEKIVNFDNFPTNNPPGQSSFERNDYTTDPEQNRHFRFWGVVSLSCFVVAAAVTIAKVNQLMNVNVMEK